MAIVVMIIVVRTIEILLCDGYLLSTVIPLIAIVRTVLVLLRDGYRLT